MMSVRTYLKWLWLCVATSLPLVIGQGCSNEYTSTEIERNIASLKEPIKRQQSLTLQTQALSPDQDFQARCAAPGVIRCNGFNSATDLTTGVLGKAGDGQIHGSIDSSVKASGAGSLRFDIPSNSGANTSGYFLTNLSADKQTFGSNKKFYVQFRQRFTQTYLSTNYGGNGWKQFILYKGTGTSGSSCTDMQLVQVSQYYSGRLHMYRSCGTPNLSKPLGDGDYLLQQGDYYCTYRVAKTGDLSRCATFKADQWMTFYYEISVGQLVKETETRYRAPMSVKAWVAYEGQGYKQYIDRPDFDVTATYSTDAFGRIQLTPYDTNKDSTIAHANTATWYDDLIISTQPIAAPGATSGSSAPVPPSPTPTVAPAPAPSTGGVALLVDFGKASGVNTFGVSGFNTVIKDTYTNNQDLGPGGMTIVTGSNRTYNYQGVRSSTARNFSAGEKIRVTWHNNSASAVSFVPKISFTDADRIGEGVGWLSMTAVNIAAYGSAISEYTLPVAASYSLVNVNVNYANQKIIVADKIELIASGVVAPSPSPTPTVAPSPTPTLPPPTPTPTVSPSPTPTVTPAPIGQLPDAPTWVTGLQMGVWTPISLNKLSDVDPEKEPGVNPNYKGTETKVPWAPWHQNSGQPCVAGCWNGGAFATKYGTHGSLLLYGGGHAGYSGNEVYAFDMNTRKWSRLNNPYAGAQTPDSNGAYADGSPSPPHTYDSVDYDPVANSFITLRAVTDVRLSSAGNDARRVYGFNLGTKKWSALADYSSTGINMAGNASAYDRARHVIWMLGKSAFGRLDLASRTVTQINASTTPTDSVAEVDPDYDLLVSAQFRDGTSVRARDLKNPSAAPYTLLESGSNPSKAAQSGWSWSNKKRAIIYWAANSADVYAFKLTSKSTGTWIKLNVSSTPRPPTQDRDTDNNRVYSKFQVVKYNGEDVAVVYTGGGGDNRQVWAMRLP